jgi:hypothetical protein
MVVWWVDRLVDGMVHLLVDWLVEA